jgi:small-conductance mechanosensitive channel
MFWVQSDLPDGKLPKKYIRNPLFLILLVIAFYIVLPVLSLKTSYEAPLSHFLSIMLIIALTWLAISGLKIIKAVVLKNYNIRDTADNLKARKMHTQLRYFERILIVIVIVIALATALMTFTKIRQLGVNILASAGIAGVIIGFAAQKSIATVLAGFQIALTQPIRIDDAVIVEGEWGWIEEINLTYVVVRIWDKRRLIVPINFFIEKSFQNWTRKSADILGSVFLYTDYTVPFQKLRNELDHVLENTNLWDGKVKVMQVTNATEKSVEIRILVSAKNSPTAWDLRVYVREKMIEYLQKNHPGALPKTRIEMNHEVEG